MNTNSRNNQGVIIGSIGEMNGNIIGSATTTASKTPLPTSATAQSDLRDLFVSLFAPWELRTFLRYDPTLQSVEPFLPDGSASPIEVASELVAVLARRGFINAHLFARLNASAPNRGREIESIRQLFGIAHEHPDIGADASTAFPPCDVLLVTVTSVEIRAVLNRARSMTGHDERSYFGRHTYHYLGEVGTAHTYAVRSEMGIGTPGGALLTVRNAITALKPGCVIMVGIAFGMDPTRQSIGDVLIARQIHYYAPDRVGTNDDGSPRIIPRGSRADASGWVLDRLRTAELASRNYNLHFGLVLSGESLVDNLAFRCRLLEREPEAIGGEMEGAGLYAAAWDTETPWVLVKGICDWGDGQKHQAEKNQSQRNAAETACDFVFTAIAQGGFKRFKPL